MRSPLGLLLLLALGLLAACSKGGSAGGATGPTTTVNVSCEETNTGPATGGGVGPTTTNVDVDCPDNSGNVTNPPAPAP